jgi:DNA-binding GntR family transcriptional regulator
MSHVDDREIARLRKMLRQEQKAYQLGDSEKALTLSVYFHRQLAAMAGNSVLEEYLNDIIRRTPLVILTHLGDDEQNRCRNQEHEAIIDALEKHDLKTATRVMHEHLLHIESKIQHKPEKPQADLATLLRRQPQTVQA